MKSTSTRDSRPVAAALTFIVILIGLGIPVWWSTTTVQRAYLPLEELSNLQLLNENEQNFHFIYRSLKHPRFLDQLKISKLDFQSLPNFSVVHNNLSQAEIKILESHNSVEAVDAALQDFSGYKQLDGLSIIEVPSNVLASGRVCVGRYNFLYISKEIDFNSFVRVLQILSTFAQNQRENLKANLPVSHKYNLLLTLATSNESIAYSQLISVFDENLGAFSRKFASVADFTISSQVVYIGNGKIRAHHDVEQNAFILNEEKMVSLINILEPRIGSQLSSDPTFHWVLYIPHEKQSPMYMYKNSEPILSNSLLSPRWSGGGLQIVNKIESYFAGLALRQLRDALGIVSLQNHINDSYISILDYDESGVHEWELYLLKRHRTIKFLNQATVTLKSLSQLLNQIGNIVVSEEIRDLIVSAVNMGDASRTALRNSNLHEAYQNAQLALKSAEKAFFDPSLLALLYFPEDQKYAIYIPLFLPVGIPVLLSLRSVYQHFIEL